jgi:hypothetical protein
MGWKCPECGNQHEDISSDCPCGYSMYKILGIKPGASGEEARQAYKYLLTVWQTDGAPHDTASGKKADERLKKINRAYEILKANLPEGPAEVKKSGTLKMALSVSGGAIILLGILVFSVTVFKTEKTIGPGPSQTNSSTTLPGPNAENESAGQTTGGHTDESPQQSVYTPRGAEITDEQAIEMVKRSHALLQRTSTESIVKKWTEDNSDKLQIIGWKARKMDDDKYLVSYVAMDGAVPKGFYFDLDIRTGEVVNLADRPDLQKKYNIQYSQ